MNNKIHNDDSERFKQLCEFLRLHKSHGVDIRDCSRLILEMRDLADRHGFKIPEDLKLYI